MNVFIVVNTVLMITIMVILIVMLFKMKRDRVHHEWIKSFLTRQEHFNFLIDQSKDGIVISDISGKIIEWNPAMERITGINRSEALRSTYVEVHFKLSPHEQQKTGVQNSLRETIMDFMNQGNLSSEKQYFEYEIAALDGKTRYLQELIFPIKTAEGYITGSIIRDVTGYSRFEEALSKFALVDDLTGLFNRRGFILLAQQQWKIAQIKDYSIMVLYADLNDMKKINDQLGHQTGDLALKETAEVLQNAFRETDIIARLGGDEFAVVAGGVKPKEANSLIKRLNSIIDEHNSREVRAYRLSISFGIAFNEEQFKSMEEVIEFADKNMYEDKNRRKGGNIR